MEVWRDELYHGLLANLRSRVKNVTGTSGDIGRKGKGLGGGPVGTGKGREWTKHKYVRKEGNRYIYPEDLKKSKKDGSLKSKHYKESSYGKNTKIRTFDSDNVNAQKARYLYDNVVSRDRASKGKYGARDAYQTRHLLNKKMLNNVKSALGDDNKNTTRVTTTNKLTGKSTTNELKSTLYYENGNQWFDMMVVNVNTRKENANDLQTMSKYTTVDYVVSKGKIHQTYDKGRDWFKKHIG